MEWCHRLTPLVELPQGQSLYQHIKRRFLEHRNKPALERNGELLSFPDVLSLIERYAVGFQRHGVSFGSRVCVSLSNSAEALIATYCLCCLGATVVLVKPTLPERDVLSQVANSDVSFIVTEKDNADKIMNIHRKCQFKALFTVDRTRGFVCIQDFEVENGTQFEPPRIEDPKNHIMLHIYTSGTMGLPKGVEISVSAYITSVELSRASEFFKERDVVLGWNPVTHASGIIMPMIAFISGAMVVPAQGGLSPKEFVDIVKKYKVTGLCAFPTAFRNLVFELDEAILPSLKRIIVCGTGSTEDLYHRVLQVFQLESLRNGYGLSETIGFLTIVPPNTIEYRNVGHPLPMVEYKQVAPAEIETLLTQHPLVLEAAVVGIDHRDLGEAPTAFVVIEPSAKEGVSEEELVRLVSDQTPFHKNLHGGVIFVDQIPKTDTGKYLRRELRKAHMDRLTKASYEP
ncbi:hypothetical protein MTO96_002417 [Rhipicephalus appendiculatus]